MNDDASRMCIPSKKLVSIQQISVKSTQLDEEEFLFNSKIFLYTIANVKSLMQTCFTHVFQQLITDFSGVKGTECMQR